MRRACQSCFQWFKDTNLKANHNKKSGDECKMQAVFNGSKKHGTSVPTPCGCFQWFKDTNLKANHNRNHNLAQTS